MGLLSTIGSASGRAFGLTRVGAAIKDAYFNLTTLLLNTGSTNGAQNNTFLDSSSNTFTITRNGNPTQGTFTPFSQTGWSNFFNGSTDYLTSTSNTAVTFGTSAYTVEMWVYQNARNASGAYLLGGAGTQMIQVNITSTGTVNANLSGGASYATTTATVPLNTWTHLAFVRTSTSANGFQIYINGVSSATGTDATNYASTNTLNIGTTNSSTTFVLNGYLSNLRVTKSGALYTSTFTPSTIPLTTTVSAGTVSLLTAQSNRFVDNSAAPFTLTTVGTPSVQAFSPFAPTAAYSTTTVGGSGYFDSNGDYLSLTNETAYDFGAGDFSIDFWYYPISAQNYATIYNRDGQDYPLAIYSGSSITPAFPECGLAAGTTTTWFVTDLFTSGVKTRSWNHIAFTRVGNTWRAFTNGVLSTVKTASGTIGSGGIPWIAKNGTAAGQSELSMNLSSFRMVKGGIPTLFSTSSTTTGTQIFSPPTSATLNSESLTAGSLSLLLNFTNAGIFDAAAKNVLETVGNASVSTTQAKFGTTSMYFDGTGDWLYTPRWTGINASENFTIEGWFYLSATPSTLRIILSDLNASNANQSTYFSLNSTGIQVQFGTTSGTQASCSFSFSANTWYYLAVTRSSNTVAIYINGTSQTVTNATQSASFLTGSSTLYVGRWGGSPTYEWIGYMDELRITKGVARTISTPTSAFPVQ